MQQKTKKDIWWFIYCGTIGVTIGIISGYSPFNWQWGATCLVITIPVYALYLIDN